MTTRSSRVLSPSPDTKRACAAMEPGRSGQEQGSFMIATTKTPANQTTANAPSPPALPPLCCSTSGSPAASSSHGGMTCDEATGPRPPRRPQHRIHRRPDRRHRFQTLPRIPDRPWMLRRTDLRRFWFFRRRRLPQWSLAVVTRSSPPYAARNVFFAWPQWSLVVVTRSRARQKTGV